MMSAMGVTLMSETTVRRRPPSCIAMSGSTPWRVARFQGLGSSFEGPARRALRRLQLARRLVE